MNTLRRLIKLEKMLKQSPITEDIFKVFLHCFDDLIVYHPLLRCYVVSCAAEGPVRQEYLKRLQEEFGRDFKSYSVTWIEWELWQTTEVCGKCKFAFSAIHEGGFPTCLYKLLEGAINWLSGLRFELPVKSALKDLGYNLPITVRIFQHYWREFGEPDFLYPNHFVIECTRKPPLTKEEAEYYIKKRFKRFKNETKVFVSTPLSEEVRRCFINHGIELIEYGSKDTYRLRDVVYEKMSKLIQKQEIPVKGRELAPPEGVENMMQNSSSYERICAKVDDGIWLFGIKVKP